MFIIVSGLFIIGVIVGVFVVCYYLLGVWMVWVYIDGWYWCVEWFVYCVVWVDFDVE